MIYPPPGSGNAFGPLIFWINDTRCVRCKCSVAHVATPDGYYCNPCIRGDAIQYDLFEETVNGAV